MADTKISALAAASALAGTETLPVVQSSATVKATIDQVSTRLATSLAGTFQGLDADLTALAALTTTAYGRALLEVANLAALNAIINAGGGIGSPMRVLWKLTGADMNSTADQAFTKCGTFTSFLIGGIQRCVNPSTSLTTAAGGVYTATSKGGDAIIASTQTYSNASTATTGHSLAVSNSGFGLRSDAALYLSLTTPQGGAATADLYLTGVPLS